MFKNLLADPLARGPDIDNPRCTEIRWSIIQKKPFLQQIHEPFRFPWAPEFEKHRET